MDTENSPAKKANLYIPPKKNYQDVINDVFNKSYHFTKDENYKLPEPASMFTSAQWQISELQCLKKDLNSVKSKLNDYGFDIWHQHTSLRNKAGDVQGSVLRQIKPEFLTQAWCKFYENVSSFPVVPDLVKTSKKFTSVHLCEAPGAFITSLNHWLKINMPEVEWKWLATTLNPYYEGNSPKSSINDDRFIIKTLDHWFFGIDDTGNVMNLDNVDALVEIVQEKESVLLVTADGSIDCMNNPGEQEIIVSHLHFCEVVTAMSILDDGGSLVLKIFTTFEHQTICLIYLLICTFEEVHLKKPATSKEGNSETYLICLKFTGSKHLSGYMEKLRGHFREGNNHSMFALEDLPKSFINQMIECSKFFKDHQCTVIMDNIKSFKVNQPVIEDQSIREIRTMVSKEYIQRYNLKRLHYEHDKIVNEFKTDLSKCLNWSNKKCYTESYNEICKKKLLDCYKRLENLVLEMQSIHLTAKCFSCKFTEELCELAIREGKPFNKIMNSKFCTPEMLHKLQELDEILDSINLKLRVPMSETVELYKDEMDFEDFTSCRTVLFNYKSHPSNWDTFNSIYNALKRLNEGQSLVLFGYCLLSRFNVGLLFILAHTFDTLELRLSEVLGCIITLKGKINNEPIDQKLTLILSGLEKARSKNMTIVSIVPISVLCDEKLYPAILDSNEWIVKYILTCSNILKITKMYGVR